MARTSDPNSAGSQFFIMHADSPFLDNQYTAFGMVTSGIETVDKIVNAPRDRNDRPNNADEDQQDHDRREVAASRRRYRRTRPTHQAYAWHAATLVLSLTPCWHRPAAGRRRRRTAADRRAPAASGCASKCPPAPETQPRRRRAHPARGARGDVRPRAGQAYKPADADRVYDAHVLLESFFAEPSAKARQADHRQDPRHEARPQPARAARAPPHALAGPGARRLLHQRAPRPARRPLLPRRAQGLRPHQALAAGRQAADGERVPHRPDARAERVTEIYTRLDQGGAERSIPTRWC